MRLHDGAIVSARGRKPCAACSERGGFALSKDTRRQNGDITDILSVMPPFCDPPTAVIPLPLSVAALSL
jgi:hypothetical protein